MKYIYRLLFIFIACFLISCDPKELPITIEQDTAVQSNQVTMGGSYENQIYFSLADNKIISSNPKNGWDLGIMSTTETNYIQLNSAKNMYAFKSNFTDINGVLDTVGYGSNTYIDNPNGKLEEIRIQFSNAQSNVYIIDLGSDGTNQLGLIYAQFFDLGNQKIAIKYRKLTNPLVNSLEVTKNVAKNMVLVSLEGLGSVVDFQPINSDWDLLFTQYTVDISIVYLVTGVLTNHHHIQATIDSINSFSAINESNLNNYVFDNKMDNIGYDWKSYQFDVGSYVLKPNQVFIIKNVTKDIYYKLQFIDFYDTNGIKGSPKFNFQRIN